MQYNWLSEENGSVAQKAVNFQFTYTNTDTSKRMCEHTHKQMHARTHTQANARAHAKSSGDQMLVHVCAHEMKEEKVLLFSVFAQHSKFSWSRFRW